MAFNPVAIPRDGPGGGSLADGVIATSRLLDIQSRVHADLIASAYRICNSGMSGKCVPQAAWCGGMPDWPYAR